jgi:UDP-glucose 4-epimerase
MPAHADAETNLLKQLRDLRDPREAANKRNNAPISPYGRSKLMVEQIIVDYAAAYGLRYVALRYFNSPLTKSSAADSI